MIEDSNLGLEFKHSIVNDMDCRFGLWVNTVGYQPIPPDSPYLLKEHPSGYYFNAEKGRVLWEYQLAHITKGHGLLSSDSIPERQVCKGRLTVLLPGQWHTYYPLRQTRRAKYYISLEGSAIDTIVGDAFLSQEKQILEVGINEELVSLFSRALEVAEADKIFAQQYLSGTVLHMIGMILLISKNKVFEMSDVDQKIEQVKIFMNGNVSGNIGPEELAMRLNISYSWSHRALREYTGYAPAKYFQELKLRRAKQILVGTSQPIKETSFFLGFQFTECFFSFFKERTGLTPPEYRPFGREE